MHGYMQFAVELKQCDELLGLIVANIDPAHVRMCMLTNKLTCNVHTCTCLVFGVFGGLITPAYSYMLS